MIGKAVSRKLIGPLDDNFLFDPLSLLLLIELKESEECFLRNFNPADLLHPPLPRLLLFPQLPLPCDIAPITLSCHIFPERLDGFPSDDLTPH